MTTAIAALVLIVAVVVGVWTLGVAFKLFVTLLTGLLVGAIARAVLPGEQPIGLLGTAASGVAGSMVGGLVADKILHLDSWLGRGALSVACAAAVVALLSPKAAND